MRRQKLTSPKKAKGRKERIKSLLAKRTAGKKEIASEQEGNYRNSTLCEPMEELLNTVDVTDAVTSADEIGETKRQKLPLNAEKQHETIVSMEDPTRSASTSARPRPTESLPRTTAISLHPAQVPARRCLLKPRQKPSITLTLSSRRKLSSV